MNRIVVATFGVLLVAGSAPAATFTVTSAADAVDATPGNGACATAGGVCTLRAAIQEANALAGADVVTLPAGTFFLTLAGASEDVAATGDLDVTEALEIAGAGVDATIVDGIGADRVFHVTPGNAFTLRGLAVRNGAPPADPGGGLRHDGGAPVVLEDVAFLGNRAASAGAVFVGDAALTIRRARFADNRALTTAGIVLHGGMANALEVTESVFERNVALTGVSAGLAYQGTGNVVVRGTRFSRNTADDIGALMATTSGAVTIEDVTIEENRALGQVGGVYIAGASSIDVRRTTVRGNQATMMGGLYAVTNGAISLVDATLEDNQADGIGGGVLQANGTLTVQNTVVAGNRAVVSSIGGMQLSAGATLSATGLTVRDNTAATDVGGIYLTGTGAVTFSDNVIEDNAALAGDVGGGYVSSPVALTAARNLVRGNLAVDGAVGGLYVSGTPAGILDSTFAENLVLGGLGAGGGLYAVTAATIVNSTFSDNFATMAGAGVYLAAGGTIDSCTFAGNESPTPGAAILGPGGTIVRGTVIGAGSGASCPAALTSGGDNVDQDGSCGLANTRDRSGIDPQLGPLQDNGGPTPTHEPLAGSPLIDGDGGTCPATDQRGVARPTDGDGDGTATCDVGAVEFVDECPQDPDKRLPGVCGCGVADIDPNGNGALDCLVNAELKARIATHKTNMQAITGVKSDEQSALKSTVKAGADDLLAYIDANGATIVKTDPAADLAKLAKKARKAVRKTLKGKGKALQKKQTKAGTALDTLDAAVAPQ